MTAPDRRLAAWADAVLLPCFDGTSAPDWVRRRVAGSLGGVCLFARNVVDVDQIAALTDQLAAGRDSVIVAIDEEAGDVTRLDAATGSPYPGAAALGRVDDPALTASIAGQVGARLAAAGVSVNFAPCADVVVDRDNPVIGSRAFGSEPDLVARHVAAWVTGQQAAGVAACAKHFPGHGDTSADSHRSAAVLRADPGEIAAVGLPPFAAAIAARTAAIMPGHLLAPAVDDAPASVSHRWLTGTLRGELGFDGVIVTDALEMAAVAGPYGIAGAAVRALAAGADLLCLGGDTRPPEELAAISGAIVAAVQQGTLSEQRLAEAAERSARLGLAAVRGMAGPGPRTDGGAGDPAGARDAARRAVQVAGPLPRMAAPVLVLRCADAGNIAIGAVGWGPARVLDPGSREIVLHAGEAPPAGPIRAAGTVLVATRDRHRQRWMTDLLQQVRDIRPDAVLVEMGITGVAEADAPAVASFGATLANAQAVVDQFRR